VWLGLAFTVFFMWLLLRDVPFAEVAKAIGRANWWILLSISVPSYVMVVYFRALRWRHLTDPIQPVETGPLFRAVSVGFMANNLFPLRMGEVVRSWYLGRETGMSVAAVFGTVILERVIDIVMVVLLAFGALAVFGSAGDAELRKGALLLLPVALAPLAVLVALRVAPERVLRLAAVLLRPLPARYRETVGQLLRRFTDGLGALRGGSHLIWIGIHSLVIWLVASTLPLIAGFLALGIDFGSFSEMLGAAWITLAAIGVAVALPSAPGFFGAYHLACKLALMRFGVPEATAVALGTLFHAVFWVTLTALGFVVLRLHRTSLSDLDGAADVSEEAAPR
jgi:uncharacterized protein (TIRG00374 family)